MLITGFSFCSIAAEKDKGNKPTYMFSGDAQLLSHFIDRGLSISDGNPALNASFLFNMGQQFRVGFWGSNISNITSSDDNLWLKIIADVHIQLVNESILKIYFNDDHFYKSDLRNGQSVGVNYDILSYMSQLEWMSNFQGSRSDALYLRAGKMFSLRKDILAGGLAGITLQKSKAYYDYLDLKVFSTYKVTDYFELEAGITLATNSPQFNYRGNPYIYCGIKLSY